MQRTISTFRFTRPNTLGLLSFGSVWSLCLRLGLRYLGVARVFDDSALGSLARGGLACGGLVCGGLAGGGLNVSADHQAHSGDMLAHLGSHDR